MSRMLAEIRQQPEALQRTLAGAAPAVTSLRRALEKRRPRLIVLVARGTSDNAALFGRYLIEITTGIPGFSVRRRLRSARSTARR